MLARNTRGGCGDCDPHALRRLAECQSLQNGRIPGALLINKLKRDCPIWLHIAYSRQNGATTSPRFPDGCNAGASPVWARMRFVANPTT